MPEDGVPVRPLSAGLKDLMEIEPLGQGDVRVLAEIRDVLLRHNAVDRFGVHLLHQHFDVADDEMLVETVDVDNRMLVTKATLKSTDMATVETSWKFASADDLAQGLVHCWLRCNSTVSGHFVNHVNW